MFGGLLLVVCVILQFHYHDTIPWCIWVLALIAQFVAFGEPASHAVIAEPGIPHLEPAKAMVE